MAIMALGTSTEILMGNTITEKLIDKKMKLKFQNQWKTIMEILKDNKSWN